MTRAVLGILSLALVWAVDAAPPAPGHQVPQTAVLKLASGASVTMRYLLFLPARYNPGETWPLMLFLHGAGQRGDDLSLVKKYGPPSRVEKNPNFGFVLVSPQVAPGERWDSEQLALLVARLTEQLAVDRDRVYVTGLSMGGYGTWGVITRYPELFAAAIPICGGGTPAQAAQMKNVAVWAFHGAADTGIPARRSQEMVDAINAAGGHAQITVYPGVGHDSWTRTYANPEVYDWLLRQRRSAFSNHGD